MVTQSAFIITRQPENGRIYFFFGTALPLRFPDIHRIYFGESGRDYSLAQGCSSPISISICSFRIRSSATLSAAIRCVSRVCGDLPRFGILIFSHLRSVDSKLRCACLKASDENCVMTFPSSVPSLHAHAALPADRLLKTGIPFTLPEHHERSATTTSTVSPACLPMAARMSLRSPIM